MSIFSVTLTRLRKEKGISEEELAREIGVGKSYIKRLETDYIIPNENILHKLAEYFDVSPEYLVGNVDPKALIKERFLRVPIVSSKTAGNIVIHEKDVEGSVVIPLPSSPDDYIAMIVNDDSMANVRIKKGDTVVIRRQEIADNGDIVAVSRNEGPVFLRKYFRSTTQITLIADNMSKDYPLITYELSNREYRILGKVVWFIGKL